MLATQDEIETVAARIEKAYRVHRPDWNGVCSTHRVWSVAAMNLLRTRQGAWSVPVDPELFVASQKGNKAYADPWAELTGDDAICRYQNRLRGIIRTLRRELTAEVKLAEDRVEAGQNLGKVLRSPNRQLSALGRYIVARRAGRTALSERFLTGTLEQHRSCPLYKLASAGLFPDGVAYPEPDSIEFVPQCGTAGVWPRAQAHLN